MLGGAGKIELLEGIARTGSLSQAAREMRMSYRRAWLLLEDMNVSFDHPVAHASVGGRGGGGVVLTPFGSRLVAGYRQLESGLQPLADAHLEDFSRHIKAGKPKRPIQLSLDQTQVSRTRSLRTLAHGAAMQFFRERGLVGAHQLLGLGLLEAGGALDMLFCGVPEQRHGRPAQVSLSDAGWSGWCVGVAAAGTDRRRATPRPPRLQNAWICPS